MKIDKTVQKQQEARDRIRSDTNDRATKSPMRFSFPSKYKRMRFSFPSKYKRNRRLIQKFYGLLEDFTNSSEYLVTKVPTRPGEDEAFIISFKSDVTLTKARAGYIAAKAFTDIFGVSNDRKTKNFKRARARRRRD